jgi:hypothetical protein
VLVFSLNIVKDLIKDYSFKFMKYFLPLLLLSAILIPISCSFTAHAQNQSANNNQNKTGQTEQDKAVKNVTQATNQVAKQASEALSSAGSQVGKAFQNLTGIGNR